jgi:hypothetical protein
MERMNGTMRPNQTWLLERPDRDQPKPFAVDCTREFFTGAIAFGGDGREAAAVHFGGEGASARLLEAGN